MISMSMGLERGRFLKDANYRLARRNRVDELYNIDKQMDCNVEL
jgi:hypothetical protein